MEELDIKQILEAFWNKKVIIFAVTLTFLIIGCIYTSFLVTPEYTASTTLVLAKTGNSTDASSAITQTDLTLNQKLVSTYSEIIKSRRIAKPVIENLKLNMSESELIKNISVTSVKDTEVIKVSVKDKNAQQSAKIANEIADVFSKEILNFYKLNNVAVLDEAQTPEKPSNINPAKDIGIFTMLGLIVSFIIVFITFYFDTTVKSPEEVEKITGLHVLTVVPEYDGVGGNRR